MSRCLLHVCCVMSHKTISCECEGESLLHVTRSERWEMWLLWREGARWMTQDVDITHHLNPVLHCYTILTYILQALVSDVLHCRLSSDGHMSLGSQTSLTLQCFLTQYPGQTALPSLVFSAPAQLSRSRGYLASQARLPLQAREKLSSQLAQWNSPPAGARVSRNSETFPDVVFWLEA